MSWDPCGDVDHDWVPVDGWVGRYRCRAPACGVLGYKAKVILPPEVGGSLPPAVVPYRCPRCHGPTTKFRRKRPGEFHVRDGTQLCPSCQEPAG